MYCKYCGKALPEDAVFCPSCGSSVQDEKNTADTQQNSSCNETFYQAPPSACPTQPIANKRKLHVFGLIGFILSCVSFLIGFADLGAISTAGFIVSLIALVQFNKNPNKFKLKGFCIAGVSVGAVGLAFFVFFMFCVGLVSCAIISTLPYYV